MIGSCYYNSKRWKRTFIVYYVQSTARRIGQKIFCGFSQRLWRRRLDQKTMTNFWRIHCQGYNQQPALELIAMSWRESATNFTTYFMLTEAQTRQEREHFLTFLSSGNKWEETNYSTQHLGLACKSDTGIYKATLFKKPQLGLSHEISNNLSSRRR